MACPKELFELEIVTDNPLFEGFAIVSAPSMLGRRNIEADITPGFRTSKEQRTWKVPRLSKVWKPPKVVGRVQPYQDFPGVDMILPAFSRRACDALRDFLEPNGELLPLESEVGEYYYYNITTVVDALDIKKSKCKFWCDPPTTAVSIDYFAFHEKKLAGRSVFRIIERPIMTIVTDQFVKRVHEAGLNGFQFNKIWPFPPGVNWERQAVKQRRKTLKAQKFRDNTLVIMLSLAGAKPKAKEKKYIKSLEDDLNAQLTVTTLDAPYFGSYEGSDIVDGEFRMFLTCPDADALERKLLPWLQAIDWPTEIYVMRRYGDMDDPDVPEEISTY